MRTLRSLFVAGLLTACGGEEAEKPPTYYADVAPLVSKHCLACHVTPNAVRSVVLTDYERTAFNALEIAGTLKDRSMPPWAPDSSGACGEFKHARVLSEQEIDTFVRWAEAGAPAGDEAAAAPLPTPEPAVVPLSHVEATLDIGGEYMTTYSDVVRCFVVDAELSRDRLLTGFRVHSDYPLGAQQVTMFALDDAQAIADAEALDAADPKLGYDCLGDSLVDGARLLAGWSWGSNIEHLPKGTGVRLKADGRVVLQVHYNIIVGVGAPDRTRVDLELSDSVKEASFVRVGPESFELKGGPRLGDVHGALTLEKGLDVRAIYPRMHLYGHAMSVVSDDGCMLDLLKWNFHTLQRLYEYQVPLPLKRGDTVQVGCSFVTENLGFDLMSGNGHDDEECSAYLYVVD